jgi:rfaE bifunctional protein nucleotidyltransferase chain/domain
MDWKEYSNSKVIDPKRLIEKIASLRAEGKKIATINGSFDLLHAGHMFMLFEASKVADVLIVGLNSDASIRAYKSPDRPIITLQDRIEMMSAIAFVDHVTWFEELDPRNLLEIIRPDVHVNGAEYGENCIEAEVVKLHGGKLHLVPRIEGLSTSNVLKKIKSLK